MSARLPFGSRRCECPTCGELFSNEAAFDRHRRGAIDDRRCIAPASTGLVSSTVAGGFTVWHRNGRNHFRVSRRSADLPKSSTQARGQKIALENREPIAETG